jgi:phage shock protein C
LPSGSSIPCGGDLDQTEGEPAKGDQMATSLQRPGRGQGRMIAGVCAAIADRFGISRTVVRVGFVIFGLVGAGELVYIALWVLVPSADR